MGIGKKFFLTLFILCLIGTYFFRDDPSVEAVSRYSKLSKWVSLQKDSSIYAVPFGPLTQIFPIFYRRGLYAGHAFPFNEDSMVEFCVRDQYLYGSPVERNKLKGAWIGESMANVYRSRRPGNFIYFAEKYPLNFVILEHDFNNFEPFLRPVFSGDGFDIYSVSGMQKNGIKPEPPTDGDTICSKYNANR
jgi:hypothetical protein